MYCYKSQCKLCQSRDVIMQVVEHVKIWDYRKWTLFFRLVVYLGLTRLNPIISFIPPPPPFSIFFCVVDYIKLACFLTFCNRISADRLTKASVAETS